MKMKAIIIATLLALAVACGAQPIIPQNVNEQIVAARYALVTARNLNTQYVTNGAYSATVAKEVQAQEDKVEAALKLASGAVAIGDLTNAKNQLDAANLLLAGLNARIAQLKSQEVKK